MFERHFIRSISILKNLFCGTSSYSILKLEDIKESSSENLYNNLNLFIIDCDIYENSLVSCFKSLLSISNLT